MSDSKILVELRIIDKGSLKATADITLPSDLGDVTVRGFRVIHDGSKAPWVGYPSSSYVKNGETIRYPLLQLSARLKNHLAEAILAEYERQK